MNFSSNEVIAKIKAKLELTEHLRDLKMLSPSLCMWYDFSGYMCGVYLLGSMHWGLVRGVP